MTAPLDLAAIRARHAPHEEVETLCDYCGLDWPCDTAALLAALDRLAGVTEQDIEHALAKALCPDDGSSTITREQAVLTEKLPRAVTAVLALIRARMGGT